MNSFKLLKNIFANHYDIFYMFQLNFQYACHNLFFLSSIILYLKNYSKGSIAKPTFEILFKISDWFKGLVVTIILIFI